MSNGNILKEHKAQSPCKLSQAQLLKFRHVELMEKFLCMAQGRNLIPSPVADCPHQPEIGSSGVGIPLKTHLFGQLE